MARPVGHSKTGGRNKGALNKRTEKLLSVMADQNYDPLKSLLERYPSLDKSAQVKIDLKLLEYVYPRLKEQSLELHEAPEADVNMGKKIMFIMSLDKGEHPEFAERMKSEIYPFNSFWEFVQAANSFLSEVDSEVREYLK